MTGVKATPLSPDTVVVVPGLRAEVPEHWQSRYAAQHPTARVVASFGRSKRDLAGRIADLQHTVESVDGPVRLLAHSAGCLVTVHWARLHAAGANVTGAVLATPPDLSRPLPAQYPTLEQLAESGWLAIPRQQLPFSSVVAVSSNDALGDPALVRGFAESWGSRVVDLGPVGHLNPASGYGDWPGAEALLDLLAAMRLTRTA